MLSRSQAEYDYRVKGLQDTLEYERKMGNMGLEGTVLRMGGAIADPVGWLAAGALSPIGAAAVKGYRLGRIGRAFVAGAEGAGAAMLQDTPAALTKPTYEREQMLYAGAGGALFGTALGGLGVIHPALAPEVEGIQKASSSLMRDVERQIPAENSVGAAQNLAHVEPVRPDAYEFSDDLFTSKEAQKSALGRLRFDLSGTTKNSENPLVSALGGRLVEDAVGNADTSVAVERAVSVEATKMRMQAEVRMASDYTSAWADYKARNKLGWSASMNGEEGRFRQSITEALENTDPMAPAPDPAVDRMVASIRDNYRRFLELAQNPGLLDGSKKRAVEGMAHLSPNDNYVPHIYDFNAFGEHVRRFGDTQMQRLLQHSIESHLDDLGEGEGKRIAAALYKGLRNVQAGQETSMSRALSGDDGEALRSMLRDSSGMSDDEINSIVQRLRPSNSDEGNISRTKRRTPMNPLYRETLKDTKTGEMVDVAPRDFMERDALKVAQMYNRQMSAQIALARLQIENPRHVPDEVVTRTVPETVKRKVTERVSSTIKKTVMDKVQETVLKKVKSKVFREVEEKVLDEEAMAVREMTNRRPEQAPTPRQRIESAAHDLAPNGSTMVPLGKLRAAVSDIPRAEQDAAFREILKDPASNFQFMRHDQPAMARAATPNGTEFSPAGEPFHVLYVDKPRPEPDASAELLEPIYRSVKRMIEEEVEREVPETVTREVPREIEEEVWNDVEKEVDEIVQKEVKETIPGTPKYLVDGIQGAGDWEKLRSQVFATADHMGLDKVKTEKDWERLDFMFKTISGTVHNTDKGKLGSFLRVLRDYNFMRVMNQVGFAQVGDIGVMLSQVGWKTALASMPSLRAVMRDIKTGQMSLADAREIDWTFAAGTDWVRGVTHLHADEFGNVMQEHGLMDAAESLSKRGTRLTSAISGMAPVNAYIQRWATKAALSKFVDAAEGNTVLNAKRMRVLGITAEEQERIFDQLRKHRAPVTDQDTGVTRTLLNLDQWDDAGARHAFEYGIFTWSRKMIQENDLGQMTTVLGDTMGKLIFQFRMFMIAGWTKNTLHNLHMRDWESMSNVLASSTLSGLAYGVQRYLQAQGRSDKDAYLEKYLSPGAIGSAAFARSGYSSLFPMVADIGTYALGMDPLFDTRVTGSPSQGLLSNPTFSLFDNGINATRGLARAATGKQPLSQKTMRAAIGTLPYSNVLPMVWMSNAMMRNLPETNSQ